MDPTGLLIIDKPEGVTSHDVVGRVRRALGTRKVGHAGTLDPMATGVLVIGVGAATRLLGHLALHDKSYRATIRLGSATVTDDREGDVISTAEDGMVAAVSDAEVEAALDGLVGDIDQRPSSVSAIKVDGRRAYDRVRSGEAVELPPRRVTIESIIVERIARGDDYVDVEVIVTCSTGTYVRAIARDTGERLGVGGHLTALRRTRVGPFGVGSALSLAEVDERGAGCLQPMSAIVPSCFDVWPVTADLDRAVRLGQRIDYAGPSVTGAVAIMGPDGQFLALAEDDAGRARYLAVFAQPSGEPRAGS